jgi:gas vesicle protein
MATFSTQVVDLVGAFSDEDALDSFVTEGANEVINAMPNSMLERVAEETPVTDGTTTSEGHKVLHMLRNDGTIDQPCRSIPARKRGRVQDASDMEYATTSDPVYWIQDGKFNLFPNGNGLLVSVPTYSQVASGGNRIDASSAEGITNFPDEAEYLVTLYASIKALQQNMSGKTSDLPSDITFPSIPVAPATPSFDTGAISVSSSAPTYTSPVFSAPTLASVGDLTLPSIPIVPTLSAQSVTITGTAPTYVKPTLSSQTAFNDYWTLGDFGDSDPGVLTVTTVVPVIPTISVASVTITGTAPTYVGPSYSKIDTYIDTDEDVELAQAKLQEVIGQVQDSLNRFNDDNVEYQAKLQKDIQDAQLTDSNEAKKLQKYSAELQTYQADVSKQVQEYTQKLSRYQLELSTVYTAWAKTESDNLAKYQGDIQNELNNFNDANVEYQAKLQKDIQDAQLSDANEARKLQKYSSEVQTYSAEVGAKVQEWVNEEWTQNFQKYQQDYSGKLQEHGSNLQDALNKFNKENTVFQNELQEKIQEANNQQTKDSAEYSAKLQKYSNEMQSYAAEVGKSVQDFSTKLQKHTTDYGWLQSQHQQLSADYQRGIQLLRGGTAPQ